MSDQDGARPLTAAEARQRGDATPAQREQLKHLLRTRRHTAEWREQLYADASIAGLSQTRALSSIHYLLQQPVDDGNLPTEATAWQAMQLADLMKLKLVPSPLVKTVKARIAAGTIGYDEADRHLTEWQRLPTRMFPAGEPGQGIPAAAVIDGYYALVDTDGRTRCYQVNSPLMGERVVKQFTGKRGSGRARVPRHQVHQVLDAIATDPATAAQRYAQVMKRCSACNQPLHDDQHNPGYPHGYGPKCWADIQKARKVADADHATNTEEGR